MGFITDFALLNSASDYQNWTYDNWSPTDNDTNATSPIYIEGSICQWWPWSKGVTNGYVYEANTGSMTGRLLVWWWNFALADIANIPVTNMRVRICSTSWTSNFAEWNAMEQIQAPRNTPISGHTPVMVYPSNSGGFTGAESNGTLVPGSLSHVGLIGTTGNTADGKQGGFDMVFLIGWVGVHSETHTNTFFDELYEQSYDSQGGGLPGTTSRPLGVVGRSGDNFTFNVNIQLGDGTSDTANNVISESGKSIYFSNIESDHNLGFVFVDPNSTHVNRLTLTNCVVGWNAQTGTSPQIFTNPNNAEYLKIDGGSFTNGGAVELPSNSANRWIKTTKFSNCGRVDLGDGVFEDNTISGATLGAIYIGSTDTRRAKRTSYSGNTSAIEFDTVGNYNLDGDKFSGNTYDIVNSDNVTAVAATTMVEGNAYKIVTVGTTDYTLLGSANNTVGTKFVKNAVTPTGTGTVTRVLLINSLNGADPSAAKVNNTGTNADTLIQNAVLIEFLVQDVSGSPIEDARINIVNATTKVQLFQLETDSLGEASVSYNYGGDLGIEGWVRQFDIAGTDYVPKDFSGTITSSGFNTTITLSEI